MSVTRGTYRWICFTTLCIIWGSSFILIKEGMEILSPCRTSYYPNTGELVMLPVAILKQWKNIPVSKLGIVFLSGLLGSFFPAYLFCLAETKIDSCLAGFLNSLTPVFTIFTGLILWPGVSTAQINWGVDSHGRYAGIAVAKGNISVQYLSYADLRWYERSLWLDINLVGRHLQGMQFPGCGGSELCFIVAALFNNSLVYRLFSFLSQKGVLFSSSASSLLGIVGTAVATVLFYILIKRSGGLLLPWSPMAFRLLPYRGVYCRGNY